MYINNKVEYEIEITLEDVNYYFIIGIISIYTFDVCKDCYRVLSFWNIAYNNNNNN